MPVKYYKVGGCVRDTILGLKSKDIDFCCECSSFEKMREDIVARGGVIFLEKPEYLTIRAKLNGEAADFVVCRSDSSYHDGRRPDFTSIGSLALDLARRDFTMNAIAEDENGELIDPFNGIDDIKAKIIRCVGDTGDRLTEDALRMLRAIRFSITKGFQIHEDIIHFIQCGYSLLLNISEDRIRDEIEKCLRFDTLKTLKTLEFFDGVRDLIFTNTKIWLKPTSEDK